MRFGFGGATALLIACAAQAAGGEQRDVALAWVVTSIAPPADPIVVRPGGIVLKQPLLPFGVATLAADAVDAKTGNLVAPAATFLLRLQADSGAVYCVATDPKRTALTRATPGSPYLRACFLDAHKDGRFDSSTEYDGEMLALPSVSGRLPKTMHALTAPVAYTGQPVQGYAPAMFVGIRFDGFAKLGGAPVFKDVYGRDDLADGLSRAWPRGGDGTDALANTGTVLLDGARVNVLENNGATLKLRVETAIPVGLFGIRQYGRSHFF